MSDSQRSAHSPSGHPPPWQPPQPQLAQQPRRLKAERLLPNLPVVTDQGRSLRFYDDVVRGRQVVLHAIFSACALYCPPATRNLLEARRLLAADEPGLRVVSLTLTPLADDPAALAAYRRQHALPADWLLLTGEPGHLETINRALGFLPAADSPRSQEYHVTSGLVGDEPAVKWAHVSTLQPPRALARMIRFGLA